MPCWIHCACPHCPPNSMLACAADIPTCDIYSDKTPPPPSHEGNHISTLKSWGGGGRVAVRHLGIYSTRLAKLLPVTSSHLTLPTAQCNCKAHRAVPRRRQAGAAARRDALRWRSGAGRAATRRGASRRAGSGARHAPSPSRRAAAAVALAAHRNALCDKELRK